MSTDPDKVECISKLNSSDLMEADGKTPSQKRIRSFLGMMNYYQHFIPNYSVKAKPLFELLQGQKVRGRKNKTKNVLCQNRKLRPEDWSQVQHDAVEQLKMSLLTYSQSLSWIAVNSAGWPNWPASTLI